MSSATSSPTPNIIIRDIETLSEMKEIEQLQRDIWGVEDLDVYPALGFKPQKEVGAVLMGAFAEGRMVGFVFGFPGILDGETIIHSDMLGILPDYRSQNLGYLLKLAQRDAAIKLGVNRITWTFDPLQSRNAHFNFSKLGVIADRYYPDYYGVTSSFLHRHGTDRLWVTWLVQSERVESRLNAAPNVDTSGLHYLVRVGENLEPISNDDPLNENSLAIEIPRDLTANHEQWRMATRDAFTLALDAGYIVEEFISGKYVLRKNPTTDYTDKSV